MSNSIALSPEQFIFAQGEELRTTSLKIAEAFGKLHKNVIRDIEQIITQTVDLPHKLKFELTQTDTIMPTGGVRKDKAYEMDKDGFMLVVMGYTGEKAMAIKIAYINAFNAMHDKLFPKTAYGLKTLPPPKTKTAIEGGLSLETQDEIKTLIQTRAAELPRDKQAGFVIAMWSALGTHFGIKKAKGDKIPAYKYIPEASRLECLSLIARLSAEQLVTMTQAAFEQTIQERVKALPAPAPLEGEVLPNTLPTDTITISLNKGFRLMSLVFNGKPDSPQSYFVKVDEDYLEIRSLDVEVMIKNLKDKGFVVFSKDDVSIRKLVNEYIPYQHLPLLIEAAAQRQQAIERGRKTRLDA